MPDLDCPSLLRRRALGRFVLAGGGLVAGIGLAPRAARAQREQLTASGSGVNVKEMPGPTGGMVPLRELFGFDAHYAQCVIEDTPAAFAMETFAMGRVVIEPHQFFMGMYASQIRLVEIGRTAAGHRTAKLQGELECCTYAGTASVTLGARDSFESALFEIEAVDAGPGGGAAGDSFAFTVHFQPLVASLNHAIFGPSPTFTGRMEVGEVTIGAPVLRPLA